ncbi:unnamed protein product [Rangifer tarandus platyrhynchus]|uniref:Uncharacterized protein n=1 Tax=Rangifer tarandus platyrhynchus TaxID=3082113 RepID=A0ABN8Y345_RANTA|nr:unnamed protein product [Rangifer tarandus platyrhynchus]
MEEVEDDKTAIQCEASSPASPQSLWLDRLHTGVLRAASPEDVRDTCKTAPGATPAAAPSARTRCTKPRRRASSRASAACLERRKRASLDTRQGGLRTRQDLYSSRHLERPRER